MSEATDTTLAPRRADVDAKQAALSRLLTEIGCEAAVLVVPAHVAWFTGGLTTRGLIADTERPGIYTNGRQRWLICSNVDTQRLFDEELDGLGFQMKEWQWLAGRAGLLGDLMAHKKIAVDRPYPNMPMLSDKLRTELRQLSEFDQTRLATLGRILTHALEATARSFRRGETEEELAGQISHRLCHRGAEPVALSVTADGRGGKYRRAGFTSTPVSRSATLQATATLHGLYVTASRTVSLGALDDGIKKEYDAAAKVAAVYWSLSLPQESIASAGEAGRWIVANSPFEFEWRQSQPGYGTGWFPVEELRRLGTDDPFVAGQAVVWQSRIASAAVVDTMIVTPSGPKPITPPDPAGWPFKRITLKDRTYQVPDILVREV